METLDQLTDLESAPRAYGGDLARIGDRVTLGTPRADARWVEMAVRLDHLAAAPGAAARSAARAMVRTWRRPRPPADSITEGSGPMRGPLGTVIAIAEEVELHGGLSLALGMLRNGVALFGEAAPREFALAQIHQGRLMRTLGHHERALGFYSIGGAESRRARYAAGEGRALVGIAAIAHQRGDLATARREYARALRKCGGIAAIRSYAQLGLCSVSLREGRLGDALRHGVGALHARPGSAERRAEVLFNIAQLCLRLGEPALALMAGSRIFRLRIQPRTRILGAGVSAVAAAHLSLRDEVGRMLAVVRRETAAAATPYVDAVASSLIAQAFRLVGDAQRAGAAAARASRIAEAHGFARVEADAIAMVHPATEEVPMRSHVRTRIADLVGEA
jgi:tetratricopeptide (TPR) repeat protein